jgi:hypothetical protein
MKRFWFIAAMLFASVAHKISWGALKVIYR